MALRRHPHVHKMRSPAMFCSLQSTSLSLHVTLSKPSNHTFVNIIIKVMNPVKGCNTEHSVVGYSPPLLLYTLGNTSQHMIHAFSKVNITLTMQATSHYLQGPTVVIPPRLYRPALHKEYCIFMEYMDIHESLEGT